MSRLLLLGIIVAVVYLLIKAYRKRMSDKDGPIKAEDMVRCIHCGMHLPKGECVMADGNCYCSEAHRRAHADQPE